MKWSARFYGPRLILTTREVEPTIEMAVRDPLVRPLRPAPSPAMWRAGRKRPTGMCTWSWEYLAFLEHVKLILVFHVSSSTCLPVLKHYQLLRSTLTWRKSKALKKRFRSCVEDQDQSERKSSTASKLLRLQVSQILFFWHKSTKFHYNITRQGAW